MQSAWLANQQETPSAKHAHGPMDRVKLVKQKPSSQPDVLCTTQPEVWLFRSCEKHPFRKQDVKFFSETTPESCVLAVLSPNRTSSSGMGTRQGTVKTFNAEKGPASLSP